LYCTFAQSNSAQFRFSDSELYCTFAQSYSAQFRFSDSELYCTFAQTDSAQFRFSYCQVVSVSWSTVYVNWADFNRTKFWQERRIALYTERFDTDKYAQQQPKYTTFSKQGSKNTEVSRDIRICKQTAMSTTPTPIAYWSTAVPSILATYFSDINSTLHKATGDVYGRLQAKYHVTPVINANIYSPADSWNIPFCKHSTITNKHGYQPFIIHIGNTRRCLCQYTSLL